MKFSFKRFLSSALAAVMTASVLSVGMVSSVAAATAIADSSALYSTIWQFDSVSDVKVKSTVTANPDGKEGTLQINGTEGNSNSTSSKTVAGHSYSKALKINTDTLELKLDAAETVVIDWVGSGDKRGIKITNAQGEVGSDSSTSSKNGVQSTFNITAGGTYTIAADKGEIAICAVAIKKPVINVTADIIAKDISNDSVISDITVKEGSNVVTPDAQTKKYSLKTGSTYTIEATGYLPAKLEVTDEQSSFEVNMTPIYEVSITETSGVEFTITDGDGNEVTKGDNGKYSLVYNTEYTISAKDHKIQTFKVTSNEDKSFTLEKLNWKEYGSFSYWFDDVNTENPENLKKGTYYLDCGTLVLYGDFTKAIGTNNQHTYNGKAAYHGDPNKAETKDGTQIKAATQDIPANGNAFSFTPARDCTIKFYVGSSTAGGKNCSFLTVDDTGNPTGNSESISNNKVELTEATKTVNATAGYTYYFFGNQGSGDSSFIGFEYELPSPLKVATTSDENYALVGIKDENISNFDSIGLYVSGKKTAEEITTTGKGETTNTVFETVTDGASAVTIPDALQGMKVFAIKLIGDGTAGKAYNIAAIGNSAAGTPAYSNVVTVQK